MTEKKSYRLAKVAKELNVGMATVVDYLTKEGYTVESNPNTKISEEMHMSLLKEFKPDIDAKIQSSKVVINQPQKETITIDDIQPQKEEPKDSTEEDLFTNETSYNIKGPKIISKINLDDLNRPKKKDPVVEPVPEKPAIIEEVKEKITKEIEKTESKQIEAAEEERVKPKSNIVIVDKIDLDAINSKKRKEEVVKETIKIEEKTKEEKIEEKIEEKTDERTDEILTTKEPEEKIQPEEIKSTDEKIIEEPKDDNFIATRIEKLNQPIVVGTIELPSKPQKGKKFNRDDFRKPKPKNPTTPVEKDKTVKPVETDDAKKKKRKRIFGKKPIEADVVKPVKAVESESKFSKKKKKKTLKPIINNEEIKSNVKLVKSQLLHKGKSKSSKYRKDKRDAASLKQQEELNRIEGEKNVLKITEYLTVNELATMMNIPVNQVIGTCMSVGLFVSINQRLEADNVSIIAEEFGFIVEFAQEEDELEIEETKDNVEDLLPRPPIVTVMGHVDHGKTKLLDSIRNANVIAGEAGGITQHIGAYNVTLSNGRKITFLDTPGHEAFTAMRARGAKVTDVAIIVIAADDGIMPQTIEAINHAQAAGVKLVFAINKIDKPNANPEKIKEQLANMNLMVEDWGGKYQSQEIAAKPGLNVDLLLEKVLLEAELLELKANPNKNANGTVLESSLDKGRGFVSTVLVQGGTLKIGDIIVAGPYYGRVKAMFNERNIKITEAGPAVPAQILGLNGAPQAGDIFNVLSSEQAAKEIATKRHQILREQGIRMQKHITLEEIGRRIAIGNFKELNIIVKGDVDGSIEALSDSLIKLSNDEIHVTVIHKAVGQITDSDIMLAAASNAIIIGFQVRPSSSARKLAEKEEIQIKLYSIIYDAIEEIKLAMEGMLSPIIKEEILGSAEIRDIFKIHKVGTIAGCVVTDGKINRTAKVRVIRDGIVVYTGTLGSLKRFKDEAKEVSVGLECGLNIENFNDIKVGDVVEAFAETEVKKKL